MIQLILIFLGVSVIGFSALALGLILSQRPLAVLAGMPEDEFQAAATATSEMAPVAVSKARLRDGLEVDAPFVCNWHRPAFADIAAWLRLVWPAV